MLILYGVEAISKKQFSICGNKRSIINNLYSEIVEQAAEYLIDENIIGLYVECNAPSKPKAHDSFDISNNKKPYVSLIAVFDEQDPKYKSQGAVIRSTIKSGDAYGNYDFSTFYISVDNYSITDVKGFLSFRASMSLIRGIILYDKYGILTEAQRQLPSVLNSRLINAYGEVQDIKINRVLSKKLQLIGDKK